MHCERSVEKERARDTRPRMDRGKEKDRGKEWLGGAWYVAPSLASGHLLFCHYKASTRISLCTSRARTPTRACTCNLCARACTRIATLYAYLLTSALFADNTRGQSLRDDDDDGRRIPGCCQPFLGSSRRPFVPISASPSRSFSSF